MYRGPAQKMHFLQANKDKSNFVPIFFHNFSGYDWHLIFESLLSKAFDRGYITNQDPKEIPKTLENYVCVQIGHLQISTI